MIVPLAVPLAPDVIVSHDALLVAVQGHPLGAVTAIEPVVADDDTLRDVGVYVTVQYPCVTGTDVPAMVNVVDRAAPVGFGAAVTLVDPLPVPEDGVTLVQLVDSDAVQAQPAVVLTENDFVSPATIGFHDVGLTV